MPFQINNVNVIDDSRNINAGIVTVANVRATNINATGIVTASNINASGVTTSSGGFVGNVTGNVTGNATGLSGTPSITVQNATVQGNLTVSGTQTIINTQVLDVADKTIGIGSTSTPSDALADGSGIVVYGTTNKTLTYNNTKGAFETNVPWSPNENRFITGSEKVTIINGNTVNLVYNTNSSNVAVCTNPTGNITLNVTGIPVTSDFDSNAITFTVLSNATGTGYSCLNVNLNGYSTTIRWAGGSSQAATSGVTTSSGYTVYSFTGINTVGSASTTANYTVLASVSGGYF